MELVLALALVLQVLVLILVLVLELELALVVNRVRGPGAASITTEPHSRTGGPGVVGEGLLRPVDSRGGDC